MAEPSSSPPATAAAASPSPSSGAKTVYLIRHAHSLENQRVGSMLACFGDLGRFSLPRKSDLAASLQLLKLEHDAPLSELGLQQCEAMKILLKEKDFVRANKIELVVHSPLQRAKQTCEELIGCSTDHCMEEEKPTQSTTSYPFPVQRVVSTSMLVEKHQLEWLPGNTASFEKRVADFRIWLAEQPESVICIVGHSQYFKRLLELPFKFDNTDVYAVKFDPLKTSPNEPVVMGHPGTAESVTLKPEWYNLKLIHTPRKPKTDTTEATPPSDASLLW